MIEPRATVRIKLRGQREKVLRLQGQDARPQEAAPAPAPTTDAPEEE
jgi:hypothetical protein